MIDFTHLTNQLKFRFKRLNVCFFFILSFSAFSQEGEMYRVVPPSPQAEAFSKYGAFPVNLATGAASVDIPVYTYQVGELSVPISLGYQTKALKVDQTESFVGLGWVLNAGGVITRTIMDQPDEEYVNNAQQEIPYPEDPSNTSDWYTNYFIDKAINVSYFDTQPDEYSYNFLGNGGKFIFSREGEVLTIPRNNFKIAKSVDGLGNGDFVITTPDGVAYHFGGGYEEISYVESVGGSNCPKNFDRHRVTSWYLHKIVHSNGTMIHLEYEDAGQYMYNLSTTQSETILDYRTGADCEQCNPRELTDCRSVLNVEQSQKLSRIYSPGMGEVNFNIPGNNTRFLFLEDIEVRNNNDELLKKFIFDYREVYPNDDFDNDDTNEPRTFLTSFTEVNLQSGFAEKTHSFGYEDMNGIPPRLSYAQDHWGYFNGANNQSLLPLSTDQLFINKRSTEIANRDPDGEYSKKGVLKSVTYPTGGSTTFSYKPHTIWGDLVSEKKSNFQLKASPSERKTDVATSIKDQSVQANFILNRTANDGTTWKDSNFYIYEITSHGKVQLFRKQLDEILPPNPDQPYPGDEAYREVVDLVFKENTEYEVEIQLGDGINMEAIIAFNYYGGETKVVKSNIEAGGIRISEMVERPESHDPRRITTYDYNVFGTEISSGIKKLAPRNISTYRHKYVCNDQTGGGGIYRGECVYKKLSSSSVGQLYSSSGNHIYYSNVTIGHGSDYNNGREEVTFKITAGDSEADVLRGNIITNAPLSNTWGEGLEAKREIYNSDGALVKRVTNDWYQDPTGSRDLKALLVVDQTGPVQEIVDFDCTDADRTKVYRRFTCTNSESGHVHRWSWDSKGPGRCVANGAINEWETFATHPCANEGVDSYTINKYDLIDLSAYYRRSDWYYNRSVKTEEYFDEDDPLRITKNFYYDNPAHLQLTRSELLANGQDIEQHFTYIPDYDESLIDFHIRELNEGHFILLVKSEKTVDGQLITGSIRRYNEIGQPVESYAYESSEIQGKPAHQSERYIDPNYFLKNESLYYNDRIAQITKSDGTATSYIWGFSGSYPVAKIENVSFENLQSTSIDLEPSTNVSEADADILYNIPGGFVTIYNYEELIGVVSILDPNGLTTYFEYDDFGRLKLVKDYKEKTLEQYEYNFVAPQETRIMELSRTALDFEGTLVNNTKTLSFTITNVGNDNLQINSHDITSPFKTNFPQNTSIPPGESADVKITFLPTEQISYSGNIQFSTNKTEGEDLVTLSGFGEDEKREMSLSETTIDFGSVAPVGIKYVDVTNNGNTPLELFCYETTNPEFEVVTSLPKTIEPGKSLQLQLSFTPQGPHQQTGTITIDSNKTSGENEISVTGKRSF